MLNSQDTRASLILRLKDHRDLAAWHEFAEIYQPLIHRLVLKKGLQHADAQEITQEVLTRVAKAVERWRNDRERGTFRGWLATITRNYMIQYLRKQSREPTPGNGRDHGYSLDEFPDPNCEVTSQFDLELERQVFIWAARRIRREFQQTTWRAF